jgi:chaperonin cofactor prefoldin
MRIRHSHLAGLSLEQRVSHIEMFARLLGAVLGLTLVGILIFAFWLGSVSAKVSASSETINRIYGTVSENNDSLLVRTSVIETRLTNVEARLDKVEARLDAIEVRLASMDSKLNNLDSKLNKLISVQSRTQ